MASRMFKPPRVDMDLVAKLQNLRQGQAPTPLASAPEFRKFSPEFTKLLKSAGVPISNKLPTPSGLGLGMMSSPPGEMPYLSGERLPQEVKAQLSKVRSQAPEPKGVEGLTVDPSARQSRVQPAISAIGELLKRPSAKMSAPPAAGPKPMLEMYKGGKAKQAKSMKSNSYAKGGSVSSASSRGDGCAQRGKTRGKIL